MTTIHNPASKIPQVKKSMKDLLVRLALIAIVNYVGLLTVVVVFEIMVHADEGTEDAKLVALLQSYYFRTYILYVICAAFSLCFLFLKSKIKYAFLLSPIVFPAIFGAIYLAMAN